MRSMTLIFVTFDNQENKIISCPLKSQYGFRVYRISKCVLWCVMKPVLYEEIVFGMGVNNVLFLVCFHVEKVLSSGGFICIDLLAVPKETWIRNVDV